MARLGSPARRIRAALLLGAFVLSLFVGRLVQLQGLEAQAYAADAENDRLRAVVLLADRGTITDATGVALATTVDAVDVVADQTLVKAPAASAAALAPLLRADQSTLTQRLTGNRRFVYLAKGVAPAVWSQVKALALPGILHARTSRRVYPSGPIAANVIGFVNAKGHGAGGLELALDARLAGVPGRAVFETGAGGRQIPTGVSARKAARPGNDVRLTIDRDLQWVAQNAIAAKVQQSAAESGTVVVMDTRTGEILALATAPAFDPNASGAAPKSALGNRALSEVYEPGSTSKVMTAAAVLEERVLTPRSPVTVPPVLVRGGKTFHDHNTHPTLHLTLAGVLAKSSNIGTILAAEKLKDGRLYHYLEGFGIGRPTGLRFPGESRGILARPEQWSGSQRYTIAFGQGLSLNTVQATSVFATLANDGVRVTPTLVKGVVGPGGQLQAAPAPERRRVVSSRTARQVREMMEAVVGEGGTAPQARIPGYRVAGKTGTAQRVDPKCSCYRGYTASFIGFAPADKPRLAISVTLQAPVRGHYGGMLGGPVFKEVMSFALQSRRVPPTGTRPPTLPLEARRPDARSAAARPATR